MNKDWGPAENWHPDALQDDEIGVAAIPSGGTCAPQHMLTHDNVDGCRLSY